MANGNKQTPTREQALKWNWLVRGAVSPYGFAHGTSRTDIGRHGRVPQSALDHMGPGYFVRRARLEGKPSPLVSVPPNSKNLEADLKRRHRRIIGSLHGGTGR